jgi:hypothetical protein
MSTTRLIEMSDDDLERLLAVARGADSVELKLTVPDEHHRSTAVALGMDPLDAQMRQVYFFDTPDLALDRHGLVVQARRVLGRGDDSVVKLRPVVPDEPSDRLRRSPQMVVEVDAMPGGWVCSGCSGEPLNRPGSRGGSNLRGWSDACTTEGAEAPGRAARARGADGVRAPGRVPVAVEGDLLDPREAGHQPRDPACVGAAGGGRCRAAPGLTTDERARLRELEREERQLRR